MGTIVTLNTIFLRDAETYNINTSRLISTLYLQFLSTESRMNRINFIIIKSSLFSWVHRIVYPAIQLVLYGLLYKPRFSWSAQSNNKQALIQSNHYLQCHVSDEYGRVTWLVTHTFFLYVSLSYCNGAIFQPFFATCSDQKTEIANRFFGWN